MYRFRFSGLSKGSASALHSRRGYTLRLESLESRELLSGTPPLLPAPTSGPIAPDLLRLSQPIFSAAAVGGAATTPTLGLPASLIAHDTAGRVGVTINAANPNALVGRLQAMGAVVTGVAETLHTLDAFVPVGQIPNLSSLRSFGMTFASAMGMAQTGAVYDQGQAVLETDRLQAATGLTGSGVTVGVMSDSFNVKGGAATDVANGDLPSNGVNVLLEGPNSGEDEGRAMSQIVHHLAPGANLDFASAFYGQDAFAQSIKDLANPTKGNAKVITDDIFYFAEPFFQDGVIAQAINTVAAGGVTYTSLAGNLGNNAYENTNPSFIADTHYTGNGANFLNFGTAQNPNDRQSLTLAPGQAVILTLEWDNPFYNTAGDTSTNSIFLLDPNTSAVLAGSQVNTLGSGSPVQVFSYQNTTNANQNVDLVILNDAGTRPGRLKWVNFGANNYGPVQVNDFATNSPTLISHSGAAGAISTGAAPYFNQDTPESYSSFGPQTVLFSADGMTTLNTPQVRSKPDLMTVDGVSTSFFPSSAHPNFFGTSAAAPHAAAVAALYLQANPNATPAQVKAALVASGRPMYTSSNDPTHLADPNQVGAGLISAFRAVNGATVPASFDVNANFDASGALSNAWSNSSRFTGQVQVAGSVGALNPVSGTHQLVLNEIDNTFSFGGASQADLNVAGAAATNGNDVGLSFQFAAVGGLPNGFPMPASFTTFTNGTGIAISTDGTHWFRVLDLNGAGSSYSLSDLNLSSIATAAGLSLTGNFQLRFEAATLNTLPNQGLAFDNLQIVRLKPLAAGTGIAYTIGIPTGPLNNLATFTDGATPLGSYTASIAWGDNSNSTASVALVNGQLVVSSTGHTYTAGGPHTYTVTLTDTTTGRVTTTTGTANIVALGPPPTRTQVAALSFWASPRGQALIQSFNGSPSSTALSTWLAQTFPNLYGASAGSHNLTGKTNAQVGAFYQSYFTPLTLFSMDAEVLNTALDVYATTLSLGGTAGQAYGFMVDANGLGNAAVNVGINGAGVGLPNNSTVSVLQLLAAANNVASNGQIWNNQMTLHFELLLIFLGIDEQPGSIR